LDLNIDETQHNTYTPQQLVIVVSCLGKSGTPARLQQIGIYVDVELRTGRYCVVGSMMKRKVEGVSVKEALQGAMQKKDDRQARRLAQKMRSQGRTVKRSTSATEKPVGKAPEATSKREANDVKADMKRTKPWARGQSFTNDAVFELKSLKVMSNPAFAEALVT
jgi:hypothetical protein